jgi:hypothetical protein
VSLRGLNVYVNFIALEASKQKQANTPTNKLGKPCKAEQIPLHHMCRLKPHVQPVDPFMLDTATYPATHAVSFVCVAFWSCVLPFGHWPGM